MEEVQREKKWSVVKSKPEQCVVTEVQRRRQLSSLYLAINKSLAAAIY